MFPWSPKPPGRASMIDWVGHGNISKILILYRTCLKVNKFDNASESQQIEQCMQWGVLTRPDFYAGHSDESGLFRPWVVSPGSFRLDFGLSSFLHRNRFEICSLTAQSLYLSHMGPSKAAHGWGPYNIALAQPHPNPTQLNVEQQHWTKVIIGGQDMFWLKSGHEYNCLTKSMWLE